MSTTRTELLYIANYILENPKKTLGPILRRKDFKFIPFSLFKKMLKNRSTNFNIKVGEYGDDIIYYLIKNKMDKHLKLLLESKLYKHSNKSVDTILCHNNYDIIELVRDDNSFILNLSPCMITWSLEQCKFNSLNGIKDFIIDITSLSYNFENDHLSQENYNLIVDYYTNTQYYDKAIDVYYEMYNNPLYDLFLRLLKILDVVEKPGGAINHMLNCIIENSYSYRRVDLYNLEQFVKIIQRLLELNIKHVIRKLMFHESISKDIKKTVIKLIADSHNYLVMNQLILERR